MASSCFTPNNQLQVCNNPQPMILQGSAFKVSHSWISLLSVELRPSSTPSHSHFHYHQASSPSPVPDPGEDNSYSNTKTFISSCIFSIHVFLWGLSAKQINIHCVTSLFAVSY
ncbi:hypothetical protein ATANTOWER_030630 [Ataeniobius toweri]|uniref:Uncharacterized protein n=1 Tax=Ataeniobius toweri TaxID=208326 RepID=A0ABU7A8Z5_9TELE|nr:hypothetical protein [Ataeniobius toweri]